jgi:hypothetical protein
LEKSDFTSKQWQRIMDEIREKLIYQAKIFKPISYGELCRYLNSCNLGPNDEALNTAFGEILVSEHRAGRGFLSSFCGSRKDKHNMPGKGFFKLVEDEGGEYKKK